MTTLLNLLNYKNFRKFAFSIYLLFCIFVVIVFNKLKLNFDEIDLLTYYTFMIGFHIQGYVSINMTNKAEKLKKIGKFGNIVKLYTNVIFINIAGLVYYLGSYVYILKYDRITLILLFTSIYYVTKLVYNIINFFNISD